MKIIIAGNGKVGGTLARQLAAEDHDITLIDVDPQALQTGAADNCDLLAVRGNCVVMDTLRDAGVESARLLIAATGVDETNLLCCATAHFLNPELHTIARVRTPEYNEQAYTMRDAFGLSLTVNPERQAAKEIERLIKYPGFLKRDTFAKGRTEIVELRLDEKSELVNCPLTEMNRVTGCRVLVCAVLRDGTACIPRGDFILQEGDRIFVTAPTDTLSVLLKNLGIVSHKVRRVVIVGGSRIAFYLAQLLKRSGITVHLIERNKEHCRAFAEAFPDACVVHGDAGDEQLLEQEGVADCDALVSLTGLDELNMMLAIYGKAAGVRQIITKLGRIDNPKIIDNLELGSVIIPRRLCSNTIVRYVRAMQNQEGAAVAIHLIADGQAEAIEFRIDEKTPHIGVPLKELRLKKDILISSITHSSVSDIPGGDSIYNPGDTVVVVAKSGSKIRQLGDIFA